MTLRPILAVRAIPLSLIVITAPFVPHSLAQIPSGYEVIQLADDMGIHSRPAIDNNGDVVWSSAFPQAELSEIYRYQGGTVDSLTRGNGYHVYPQISTHSGMIAWRLCEGFSGDSCQPVLLHGKTQELISTEFTVDELVVVNDAGHMVWSHDFSGNATHMELFYYDGVSVSQLTNNGLSNQNPRINNSNQIVWTKFDFSKEPWHSTIMLHSGSQQVELSGSTFRPVGQDINDNGQVVWGSLSEGVELWESGATTVVTSDGIAPRINNKGEIVFARRERTTERWVIWLYQKKENSFRRLSDPAHSSSAADLNDAGEVAWHSIVDMASGKTGVFLMKKITGIPAISPEGFLVLAGALLLIAIVFAKRRLPRLSQTRLPSLK